MELENGTAPSPQCGGLWAFQGQGETLLIQGNCAGFGLVVSVIHITKRFCSAQENSVAPVGTTEKNALIKMMNNWII